MARCLELAIDIFETSWACYFLGPLVGWKERRVEEKKGEQETK
jgi:hypothetical protein